MSDQTENSENHLQEAPKAPPTAASLEKKKDPYKKLKNFIEILKSPATLGVLLTLFFIYISMSYYKIRDDVSIEESDSNTVYRIFRFLDSKNMDLRFTFRGPEVPQAKIAVLAIDDKSIGEIGRWPWGRDKMATLVDNTMSYGAKAIGFDIVFSEEQKDLAAQALETVEQKLGKRVTKELATTIAEEKNKGQYDQKFAKVVTKWKDKLVLGAFAEAGEIDLEPYQNFCFNEAFKKSPFYDVLEKEELPPFVIDSVEFYGQIDFTSALKPVFESIRTKTVDSSLKDIFQKNSVEELNSQDKARLDSEIAKAYRFYCARWLTAKDEHIEYYRDNWENIFKSIKEFKGRSFEHSIEFFKNTNAVHPILPKMLLTANIDALKNVSSHTSLFNAVLDKDGTLRTSPLLYRFGTQFMPSLALQTFLTAESLQGHFQLELDHQTGNRFVKDVNVVNPESEASYKVPTDSRARILINYAGPQQMFAHVPASELFTDKEDMVINIKRWNPEYKRWIPTEEKVKKADFIKDRTFIVGATAVGVYDLRVTPFEENYPGVETHVNILNNLMTKNFIYVHPNESSYMLIALLALGLGMAFSLAHLSAVSSLILGAVAIILIFIFDQFILFKHGYIATMSFPLLLVTTEYVGLTFYKYITEERKKKHLRSTFSKYVSPAIVDEILKDPENIELGGKKMRMTVFFSDVRGFTTISEKLEPQVLSKVLSDYLTPMTQIVFENKGTLDKYMGDAIMAFFGAPIHYDDHAKYACRCALQNIAKLKEIQLEFKKQGYPHIDIGIGINTGDMSAGNMGSDIVRSYTVMGDSVNLGSRLEGINKEYGTRIIISEYTYEDIKNDFSAREIDWVRVKGKYQPIRIFELLSEGAPPEEFQEMLEHYNKGFQLYHEKKFGEAIEIFNLALQAKPDDPVSQLYIERCQDYLAEPPPEKWDGVHIMKTK